MLALKILKADKQEEFDKEREALSKIQHCKNPHLITLIASFKLGSSFHFLFPWAEGGDLRFFWQTSWAGFEQQHERISWGFGQMIGIAKAIDDLHKVQPYDDDGGADKNGRHGDLRPENILAFRDEQSNGHVLWKLCITDAGLAKFHERITDQRIDGTTTTRGSIEYAPPESRDKNANKPRSRKYDLWSLGCIFLEFAIWMVEGPGAIKQSREKRLKDGAYQAYHRKDKLLSQVKENAYKLRPPVKEDISSLRDERKYPIRFRKLADIIENKLLAEEEKRFEASQLVPALEYLVIENPSPDVVPQVVVDGSDRDNNAPPPNQEPAEGGGRRRRRDALLDLVPWRFGHQ